MRSFQLHHAAMESQHKQQPITPVNLHRQQLMSMATTVCDHSFSSGCTRVAAARLQGQ